MGLNTTLVAGLPTEVASMQAWRGSSAEVYRYATSVTLEKAENGINPTVWLPGAILVPEHPPRT